MNIAPPQPYTKVPFAELQAYLQNTASAEEVNYIEVTDIEAAALFIDDENWENLENFEKPSLLGKILKQSGKEVALKLPKTVENLYSMHNCFWGCSTLVSLEAIPEGVVDMSYCFNKCTSLVEAPALPDSVTNMHCFFKDCTSLTAVPNIPDSVTDMRSCFNGCTSLTSVTLKCGYLDGKFNYAFDGCSRLSTGSIKVPADSLDDYKDNADKMKAKAEWFAKDE